MTHYNFIEIGTSDFDTLIQTCGEEEYGISIDAVKYYIDRLPEKKNVRKINAGISDKDGFIDVYYMHPNDIEKHDISFWVRGCNSIGKPHPIVVEGLSNLKLPLSLIKVDKVVLKTIQTLFLENDVKSIDYLKIDTEGHDCIIMNSYIDYCMKHPEAFAKKIRFETNKHSLRSDQTIVIERLIKNGYRLVSFEEDAVLERI
jgi:hypothetical protein